MTMVPVAAAEPVSVPSIFPVQRRLTLEVLRRFGPLPVEAIPLAWPLTRDHQRRLVEALESEGAVRVVSDPVVPGRPLVRITDAGAELLGEMTDEAMRALIVSGDAVRDV
jgi:hypothetical protein